MNHLMNFDFIIATGNTGKAREISDILALAGGSACSLRVIALSDAIGFMPNIDENGNTLYDNAQIKARAARKALQEHDPDIASRAIVIADDSGLFVDCLDGRPGVHSARYAGPGATPAQQIAALLAELGRAPSNNRQAAFRCAMVAICPDGREFSSEGARSGEIGLHPIGSNGFGYDPIFYLQEYKCTMAELPGEEKNKLSHRAKALAALVAELDDYLKNLNSKNSKI